MNILEYWNFLIEQQVKGETITKGTQIGKEEVKLSLFADDMILYTENAKEFTRTLVQYSHGVPDQCVVTGCVGQWGRE